jgi:hypothetical protein
MSVFLLTVFDILFLSLCRVPYRIEMQSTLSCKNELGRCKSGIAIHRCRSWKDTDYLSSMDYVSMEAILLHKFD